MNKNMIIVRISSRNIMALTTPLIEIRIEKVKKILFRCLERLFPPATAIGVDKVCYFGGFRW